MTFKRRITPATRGFQNPSLHIKAVFGKGEKHFSASSTTNFSSCSALCTMPRPRPRQKTVKLLSPPQAYKNFTGSEKIANHDSASENEARLFYFIFILSLNKT